MLGVASNPLKVSIIMLNVLSLSIITLILISRSIIILVAKCCFDECCVTSRAFKLSIIRLSAIAPIHNDIQHYDTQHNNTAN